MIVVNIALAAAVVVAFALKLNYIETKYTEPLLSMESFGRVLGIINIVGLRELCITE